MTQNRMKMVDKTLDNTNKIRYKTIIGLISVFLLVAIIVTWLFLPRLANHFHFAVPLNDPEGLPFRVIYNGRSYMNPSVCAGDNWCHVFKPECHTQESLTRDNQWPLKQVGELPALFGKARPILMPAVYTFTTVVYVPYGDKGCYLNYGLEGGA
jgi:hypothetical protein